MSRQAAFKPTAVPTPEQAPDAAPASEPRTPASLGEAPVRPRPVEARSEATPPSGEAPAGQATSAPPKSRSGRRRVVVGVVGILALIGAAVFGYNYWTVGRFEVSTDDAYVGANMAQLSARVPARVADVRFEANQRVTKGQPLVVLDDGDYRLAVEQAKARLATQEAGVTRIGKQIVAARALTEQAQAQRTSAEAELARAEADFKRTESLATQRISSQAALDTSRAARDKARAAVVAARAGVTSAETNVAVLEAQRIEAERTAQELKVAVDKAERDLDATVIRAPLDGIAGNKSVQVGDYVTPGKRLAAVVPLDDVYVDANFKETQLARIRPGQRAHVSVDAAGGSGFDGTVTSLAPASGSQFSLLPPENATGNFTKIVQRVPVRIHVPREMIERGVLRPGLSVVVTIDTRTGPKAAQAPAKQASDSR